MPYADLTDTISFLCGDIQAPCRVDTPDECARLIGNLDNQNYLFLLPFIP